MSARVSTTYSQECTPRHTRAHTLNLLLPGQQYPQRPKAHNWGKDWSTDRQGIPLNQHTHCILPFFADVQQIQCDPSSHKQSKSAANQQIRAQASLPSRYRFKGFQVLHARLPFAPPVHPETYLMAYEVLCVLITIYFHRDTMITVTCCWSQIFKQFS